MGLGYFSTNANGGINSLCDFTKARSDIEAQGIERCSENAHEEAVSRQQAYSKIANFTTFSPKWQRLKPHIYMEYLGL